MAKTESVEPENFRAWLSQFVNEDSLLGDLARAVAADAGWEGRTAASLQIRLVSCCADPSVIRAFAMARNKYYEEMGSGIRQSQHADPLRECR